MIQSVSLECGLTLLIEPIASVGSCSLHWVLPAGTCFDESDRLGISSIRSEMLFRGAGDRESRQLSDDMDRIGLERDCGTSSRHGWVVGSMLGRHLEASLTLLVDIIRRPCLPEESVDACRRLAQQAIESLEDEPQHEAMLYLRRRHQPEPFNRNGYGFMAVAKTASREEIVASWESGFVPEGSILALAGDVDANAVIRRLDALLGGWRCGRSEPVVTSAPTGGHGHVSRDSTQVHIGLAWPAPSAGSDDSTLERVATRILGGSTSGRLFTEVRQRRSLCYTVSASYRARRDDGDITLYAGTTAERAVETLEVCEAQINRMKDGVSIDEFTRAMAGLRGSTVFNGERTQARAAAMVTDQYNLGAARSMEDRLAQLDSVTLDDLNAYLTGRVDPVPTIVTVGPEPLRPDFEEEPPLCHPSP